VYKYSTKQAHKYTRRGEERGEGGKKEKKKERGRAD
jgi:hypothetical protein